MAALAADCASTYARHTEDGCPADLTSRHLVRADRAPAAAGRRPAHLNAGPRGPMPISRFIPGQPSTRLLAAGALCATVFLVAGCAGDESPAGPESAAPDGILATVVKTPVVGTEIRFEDCLGEEIRVDYREQLVEHESVDAQGRIHIHTNINDRGSSAVGLTSGTTYRQVGTSRENDLIIEGASLPKVFSFRQRARSHRTGVGTQSGHSRGLSPHRQRLGCHHGRSGDGADHLRLSLRGGEPTSGSPRSVPGRVTTGISRSSGASTARPPGRSPGNAVSERCRCPARAPGHSPPA